MAAVRSGLRAIILQATQAWPFEPYVADNLLEPGKSSRILLLEGYAGILGHDGVITARDTVLRPSQGWTNLPESAAPPREISFTIGTTRLFGLLIDDPADPVRGYDTLIVTRVKDGRRVEARLKAGDSRPGNVVKWSSTIEVKAAGQPNARVFMRLFELKATEVSSSSISLDLRASLAHSRNSCPVCGKQQASLSETERVAYTSRAPLGLPLPMEEAAVLNVGTWRLCISRSDS
jgi:hypothetical protein